MPKTQPSLGLDLSELKPDYDPTEPVASTVTWFHSREWQEFIGNYSMQPLGPSLEQERQQALAKAFEDQQKKLPRARPIRDQYANPSPQLVDAMCALIMQGVFPWVAGASCGITRAQMRRLQETNEDVMHAIDTAHGTARASAEMRVYANNPEFWLQKGPGKQRPDAPGWGEERALTGAQGADLPVPVAINHLSIEMATDEELKQIEQLYETMDARVRGALPLESPPVEME